MRRNVPLPARRRRRLVRGNGQHHHGRARQERGREAAPEAEAHVQRILDRPPTRESQFIEATAGLAPEERAPTNIARTMGHGKATDAGPTAQRLDRTRRIIRRGRPYRFQHLTVEAYLTSTCPDENRSIPAAGRSARGGTPVIIPRTRARDPFCPSAHDPLGTQPESPCHWTAQPRRRQRTQSSAETSTPRGSARSAATPTPSADASRSSTSWETAGSWSGKTPKYVRIESAHPRASRHPGVLLTKLRHHHAPEPPQALLWKSSEPVASAGAACGGVRRPGTGRRAGRRVRRDRDGARDC